MEPSAAVNRIGAMVMGRLSGGNVLISPTAVARDLAVLAGGTDPLMDDGKRIMEVLGAEDLEGVRSFASALVRRVRDSPGDAVVEASDLMIVNSASGYAVSDGYRGWLESFGNASIEAFDLSEHLDDAVSAIASWASDSTGGHMQGYSPGIDADTELALYDSFHLKGRWTDEFDPSRTCKKRFTLADSSRIKVDMMRSKGRLRYHEDAGYRAVTMDLQGYLTFCVVLPSDGRPDIGERWREEDQDFRLGFVDALLGSPYTDVRLSFPRTEASVTTDLNDILGAIGLGGGVLLPDIVDGPLELSGGSQAVRLSIDEEGLEASSIIEDRMFGCAPPQEPVRFEVDIPFVFFVRDEDSGMDLFAGYVGDPNGGGIGSRVPGNR